MLLRLLTRYAYRILYSIDTHSLLQALAKNPKNSKALFRKAKALGEQGYFEKAEAILTELLKEDSSGSSSTHLSSLAAQLSLDGPIIQAELARLRAADKVREKEHNKKFKGM